MGKNLLLVKPNAKYTEPDKINSLYTRAINCRKEHFYKASGIDFIIWRSYLDFLNPNKVVPQNPQQIEQLVSVSPEFDISISENRNE